MSDADQVPERSQLGDGEATTGPASPSAAGSKSWYKVSRRTESGERRWPMALAVLTAVVLQVALPDRHVVHPTYLFPISEVILLVALILGDPGRIDRTSNVLRRLTIVLILILTIDNLLAVVTLVDGILDGSKKDTATVLLGTGVAIWLTNVIVFSLWYWELDRGGPAARATGTDSAPAFTFPEMQSSDIVGRDWQPQYVDYLYLAFTNATAFSPTDTLPIRSWAKMMMLVQSAVSLVTGIMVISRAVNILN